jgi:hypothetical protein
MAEPLENLPEDFDFHPLHGAQTYMSNLTLMATVFKQMHAGYNSQIQSGADAATALAACLQALADNLEASATHLPLQSGQANKILQSQGADGQAFWGGEWELKTASFELIQLDSKITLATTTDIDITLKTPEKVGMHVLLHNSLQSTEKVRIMNPLGTIIGLNESWVPGENIIINPGETFQAFCTDISETEPVWELF